MYRYTHTQYNPLGAGKCPHHSSSCQSPTSLSSQLAQNSYQDPHASFPQEHSPTNSDSNVPSQSYRDASDTCLPLCKVQPFPEDFLGREGISPPRGEVAVTKPQGQMEGAQASRLLAPGPAQCDLLIEQFLYSLSDTTSHPKMSP